MLRFDKLTITNFGPFRGTQTIDFGKDSGVTIIWGSNGRGKTTLLNVFRYALFGEVRDKRGSSVDLLKLSNLEELKNKNFGFKIVLTMTNGEDKYSLTRSVRLREESNINPQRNEDFLQEVFLKKNGVFVAYPNIEHEISLIMPNDISRFFLFDGELMEDYYSLLDENSNEGGLIKESIEKILGMPILTNALQDIDQLVAEYVSAKNKSAQNDENSKEYAVQSSLLQDQIEGHEIERTKLENLLNEEQEKLKIIQKNMSESVKYRQLASDLRVASSLSEKLKEECEELEKDIQSRMKNAWQSMIYPIVLTEIGQIKDSLKTYDVIDSNTQTSLSFTNKIEEAIRKHECGVCGQKVSNDLIVTLKEKLEDIKNSEKSLTSEERHVREQIRFRLTTLQSLEIKNDGNVILSKVDDLNKKKIELTTEEQRLRELEKQMKTFGNQDSEIENLPKLQLKAEQKIKELQNGITKERDIINETKGKRDKLDLKVGQLSKNKDVLAASKREEISKQISRIFSTGIEEYRLKLKSSVETDATNLFTQMSADNDYKKLKINDNYGLEIIHKDNIVVPRRSTGFEHVVALSLIGALHKNAPLQGPVIMDSPFGRLDSKHEKNVVTSLPLLSEQVILLVHENELSPEETNRLLGRNLLKEYEMERVTSFHTNIN